MMDRKEHWENVHATKLSTEVSWYQSDPKRSIELISSVSTPASRVIEVGGGQSFLVDSLLDQGYRHLTVLDVAQSAVDGTRGRLSKRGDLIQWIVDDITQVDQIAPDKVWHDRAVFRFLTDATDRPHYVNLLHKRIVLGGYAILGTFAHGDRFGAAVWKLVNTTEQLCLPSLGRIFCRSDHSKRII